MNAWGKIIGGAFGAMLGGPFGSLLGVLLGHNFDKGLSQSADPRPHFGRQERIRTLFYAATFSVMGHICKADGRVTQTEIALAKQIMRRMDMNNTQRKVAINFFNEGKKAGFRPDDVIAQLKRAIPPGSNLRYMFIEIQIMAAYADGIMHPTERGILLAICRRLGISAREFEHLCHIISAMNRSAGGGQDSRLQLEQAYAVLNIAPSASVDEIKKTYRRLLNQHHPDKLVVKGLPEEMMKVATENTQKIRKAYEIIKEHKRF